MLVSDSRILQVAQRNRFIALIAAIIFSLALYLGESDILSLPEAILMAFIAIASWCWLVTIIGFGSQLLNFTNRTLRYANDAVLPVYILHQTIIITLGFYVVKWDTGVALKYPVVVISTLAISLAIYEAARRTKVTRFQFGMRSIKKPKRALAIAEN